MALKHLIGHWYLIESTLNFWKNNSVHSPEINFTLSSGKFINEVNFFENNQSKSIKGYDFFLDKSKLEFLYQMRGWKFFIKGKWRVEYFGKDRSWAVISMDKTIISKPSLHIISRTPDIDPDILSQIHSKISDLGYLKGYISRLSKANSIEIK